VSNAKKKESVPSVMAKWKRAISLELGVGFPIKSSVTQGKPKKSLDMLARTAAM
jgi:hypothetical protein